MKKIKLISAIAVLSFGAFLGTALTISLLDIRWSNKLFVANLILGLILGYLIYRKQDLSKPELLLAALAGIIYLVFAVVFNFYSA